MHCTQRELENLWFIYIIEKVFTLKYFYKKTIKTKMLNNLKLLSFAKFYTSFEETRLLYFNFSKYNDGNKLNDLKL